MTKFGVHLGLQVTAARTMRQGWEALDGSGFGWLSVADRAGAAPTSQTPGEALEAVAGQAAMAVTTQRARIGCLVYSAAYRHPAALAMAGATLDQLSHGRLEMGIGAGWSPPGDDYAVRLRRMKECAEVVRLLWTEASVDYDGEFFQLRDARCDPKPVQQPPRIWVGTAGGTAALEIAGRVGDGWNAAFLGPDDFARKLAVVKAAAPDPDRVATSVTLGFLPVAAAEMPTVLAQHYGAGAGRIEPGVLSGSIDAMLEMIGRYVAAGADWVILAPLLAPELALIDGLVAFGADAVLAFGY